MERTLRSYLWPAAGYFVILEVMLAAAIGFWPNFRDNIGPLRAMAPLPMLKDMVDVLEQGGVSAYVNGQHFFKGCNTLGLAAAVLFSTGAVAGEAHRGTLEIWLARPFSRRRILVERWVAGALALTVPIFLTSATVPWLLSFHEEEMHMNDLMRASLNQSVFLLCFYSLTFYVSTRTSKPTKLALVMIFLSTMEFALYLVKEVTHWSVFRLADIEVYLHITGRDALNWQQFGPMLAFNAIFFVLALRSFERRIP